jgi:hypothetical protein
VERQQLDTGQSSLPSIEACEARHGDARKRHFLFGGFKGGTAFGDTWKFDGTNWTLLSAPGPSPRTPAIFVAY